jgi:hypothetical protein
LLATGFLAGSFLWTKERLCIDEIMRKKIQKNMSESLPEILKVWYFGYTESIWVVSAQELLVEETFRSKGEKSMLIKFMRFFLPSCNPPNKWSLNHKDIMEIEILNLDLSHELAIVRINEETKLVSVRIHSDFKAGDEIGEMIVEYNEKKIFIFFIFKRKKWKIDKVKITMDGRILIDW